MRKSTHMINEKHTQKHKHTTINIKHTYITSQKSERRNECSWKVDFGCKMLCCFAVVLLAGGCWKGQIKKVVEGRVGKEVGMWVYRPSQPSNMSGLPGVKVKILMVSRLWAVGCWLAVVWLLFYVTEDSFLSLSFFLLQPSA